MRQLATVAAFVFNVSMLINKNQILLLILILAGLCCNARELQHLRVKACHCSSLIELSCRFRSICEQFNINFSSCHNFPERNAEINKWLATEIDELDLAQKIRKELYAEKINECAELNGCILLGALNNKKNGLKINCRYTYMNKRQRDNIHD